jgi:hypothetical protein
LTRIDPHKPDAGDKAMALILPLRNELAQASADSANPWHGLRRACSAILYAESGPQALQRVVERARTATSGEWRAGIGKKKTLAGSASDWTTFTTMIILLSPCLLLSCELGKMHAPAPETASKLEAAKSLQARAEQARLDGNDARPLYRELAETCARVRHEVGPNASLCADEGHAAALAGDWPHALLAYRLAQQAEPQNKDHAESAEKARSKLGLAPARTTALEQAESDLSTNDRLRNGLWLVAALLYVFAWLQFAHRHALSGMPLARAACAGIAACAIVLALGWADRAREAALKTPLVIVQADDAAILRQGNGLAYAPVLPDRLRPGTEARLLTRRGDWVQVRTEPGATGWIMATCARIE